MAQTNPKQANTQNVSGGVLQSTELVGGSDVLLGGNSLYYNSLDYNISFDYSEDNLNSDSLFSGNILYDASEDISLFSEDESDVEAMSEAKLMSASYTSADGNWNYGFVDESEGTIEISGYNGSETNLVIPSTIDGYTVTVIGYYAFMENSLITSVVIPDEVTSIGVSAFYACKCLKSVVIPEGVTSIGEEAFGYCSSLEDIEIPESATSVGYDAFKCCGSLTNIKVTAGNKNYSSYDGALYDKNITELICCPKGKTSITIPDGVTSINSCAFYCCDGMTSIELPDGVTMIGSYSFYGCSSLTSIELPKGVTRIEASAFRNCSSLESIEIPNGVTLLANCIFYHCDSLKNVVIPDSVKKFIMVHLLPVVVWLILLYWDRRRVE